LIDARTPLPVTRLITSITAPDRAAWTDSCAGMLSRATLRRNGTAHRRPQST